MLVIYILGFISAATCIANIGLIIWNKRINRESKNTLRMAKRRMKEVQKCRHNFRSRLRELNELIDRYGDLPR